MSDFLEVYGASTHNLKNIDVKIPKNKLTVITGISGSGKSSLAFKTIYSIGQQKYLESLSSYARMFIGGMSEEALYKDIVGLSPTICIDQKTTTKTPRSTVGTITEIYDYYKLLYLNLGDRKCVKCGHDIKTDSISDVVYDIGQLPVGTKIYIKVPILTDIPADEISQELIHKEVLKMGCIRYMIGENIYTVNDTATCESGQKIFVIIDRLITKNESDENFQGRLKESIEMAFTSGKGIMMVDVLDDTGTQTKQYSNVFICSHCGHVPAKLDISSFSFNSPHGSCPDCHGIGEKAAFLEKNIINPRLSIAEGAVLPWFGSGFYKALLLEVCKKNSIDPHIPYKDFTRDERKLILYGTGEKTYGIAPEHNMSRRLYHAKYKGIIPTLTEKFFNPQESGYGDEKITQYVTYLPCPTCHGHRLNEESLSVYFHGFNIGELCEKTIEETLDFFQHLELSEKEQKIAKNIFKNIIERLTFLSGVGLQYMTLARKSNTLSGGESQRIRLATQIGTKLEGIIYVLDEPSIGLHPRDNDMLISHIKKLTEIGNTVIVVEHDEDIMKHADHIVDIGPGAGIHGGEIVAQGTFEDIITSPSSVTGPYLAGRVSRIMKRPKRTPKGQLLVKKASFNNLKNIDVSIPLGMLTVVTGVSGSGKSSLVNSTIAPFLLNVLNRAKREVGTVESITGYETLEKVIVVDQSPIGRTPRSNPAIYTGAFDAIREVFATTQEALSRGYKAGRFSFNTKSGRCPHCDGDGVKKIEMHFLPPVYVKCDYCDGKRYNKETLEVTFKGKNIADILDMTVEEAMHFFRNQPKIVKILQTLDEVGLGYIKLGQSSTTLSGGESQRIKLAEELSKRQGGKNIYILDEPTTGLHFQDTQKLLSILHGLVDKGNTVLVIEHNMDVILNADHIVDIGPGAGIHGGKLVVAGSIQEVQNTPESFTGQAIQKYLSH